MLRRSHGVVLTLLVGLGTPTLATSQEPDDHNRLVIGPEIRVGGDLPGLPHVEPVIAVNPDDPDNLVVASIVVRETLSEPEFHDSWTIHALASTDAGATWTRHRPPGLETTFAADPWLAWAEDGRLFLSGLAAVRDEARGDPTRALLYESTDGGREWSGPVESPTARSTSYGPTAVQGSISSTREGSPSSERRNARIHVLHEYASSFEEMIAGGTRGHPRHRGKRAACRRPRTDHRPAHRRTDGRAPVERDVP